MCGLLSIVVSWLHYCCLWLFVAVCSFFAFWLLVVGCCCLLYVVVRICLFVWRRCCVLFVVVCGFVFVFVVVIISWRASLFRVVISSICWSCVLSLGVYRCLLCEIF